MFPPQTKTLPTEDALRTITILSLSPIEQDHLELDGILNRDGGGAFPGLEWNVCAYNTPAPAIAALQGSGAAVVVCGQDSAPGMWKEMLAQSMDLPDPPLLIVTSTLADSYLWAEALNLGAYDVLAKPFEPSEVRRIISLAGIHWTDKNHRQQLANASVPD